MFAALRKIFDTNQRDVAKLRRSIVEPVNKLESEIEKITDLAHEFMTLRELVINGGKSLDDVSTRAFAIIREAAKRTLGKRHYDVQIVGGMSLHMGRIAEMRTGEGKTLVATLALALNALEGKGCHLVTVNDYLARVGAEEMGLVFRTLGLSVGLIQGQTTPPERRVAYACDITYVTNSELGFDYLRDNMAQSPEQLVLRADHPLNFAIIDEVDSILIDEARTPLIISGPSEKATDQYYLMAKLIKRLRRGEPVEPGVREEPTEDYIIEEKSKAVHLTEKGISRVETLLSLDNLYSAENMANAHMIVQAIRANELYHKDKDYLITEKGEIVIVDEFTGRAMQGRRYGEGLHQAIEAKEGVKIENENQTLATVTYQNFFKLYNKRSGMTGTAKTEEKEFIDIYGVDVLVIPTNLPVIRKDSNDLIYRSNNGKYGAVVAEIKEIHATGRPMLVGTVSIRVSEVLSEMLTAEGLEHQVLNAKYEDQEAKIVAQAGRLNGITIATNMAGRGTDITLGGNIEYYTGDMMERVGLSRYAPEVEAYVKALVRSEPEMRSLARGLGIPDKLVDELERVRDQFEADRLTIKAAGGLHIIGTERHESRRIDNQLRGRAGRQGDPGSSRFFCSFEDELMRLFANENTIALLDRLGMDDTQPIEAKMVTGAIERAQARVEDRNFATRKQLLEFDNILSTQRESIYGQRREMLLGADEAVEVSVESMIGDHVENLLFELAPPETASADWDTEKLRTALTDSIPALEGFDFETLRGLPAQEAHQNVLRAVVDSFDQRKENMGSSLMVGMGRYVLLQVIDQFWKEHLHGMDVLRQGIFLRSYGQRDPFQEYKFEATNMFNEMIDGLKAEVTKFMFRLEVGQNA
jgi:preprotein translocase subunit SecA